MKDTFILTKKISDTIEQYENEMLSKGIDQQIVRAKSLTELTFSCAAFLFSITKDKEAIEHLIGRFSDGISSAVKTLQNLTKEDK